MSTLPPDISLTRPKPLELWVEVTKGQNKGRFGLAKDESWMKGETRIIYYVGGPNARGRVSFDRTRYLTSSELLGLEKLRPAEVDMARSLGMHEDRDILYGRLPMADGDLVRCYIQPSATVQGEWTLHDNSNDVVLRTYSGADTMGADVYSNLMFDHQWYKMQGQDYTKVFLAQRRMTRAAGGA